MSRCTSWLLAGMQLGSERFYVRCLSANGVVMFAVELEGSHGFPAARDPVTEPEISHSVVVGGWVEIAHQGPVLEKQLGVPADEAEDPNLPVGDSVVRVIRAGGDDDGSVGGRELGIAGPGLECYGSRGGAIRSGVAKCSGDGGDDLVSSSVAEGSKIQRDRLGVARLQGRPRLRVQLKTVEGEEREDQADQVGLHDDSRVGRDL